MYGESVQGCAERECHVQELVERALECRMATLGEEMRGVLPYKLDKSVLESTTVPRLMLDFAVHNQEEVAAAAAAAAEEEEVPLKELVPGVEAFDMTSHCKTVKKAHRAFVAAHEQFKKTSAEAVRLLRQVAEAPGTVDASLMKEASDAREKALDGAVAVLSALEECVVRKQAYDVCAQSLVWQKSFAESLADEVERRKKLYVKLSCALDEANEVMDSMRTEDEEKRHQFCEQYAGRLGSVDKRLHDLLVVAPAPRFEVLPSAYDSSFVVGAMRSELQSRLETKYQDMEKIIQLSRESEEQQDQLSSVIESCLQILGHDYKSDDSLSLGKRALNAVQEVVQRVQQAQVPAPGDKVVLVVDKYHDKNVLRVANIREPLILLDPKCYENLKKHVQKDNTVCVTVKSCIPHESTGGTIYFVDGDHFSV